MLNYYEWRLIASLLRRIRFASASLTVHVAPLHPATPSSVHALYYHAEKSNWHIGNVCVLGYQCFRHTTFSEWKISLLYV